jgi:DNA processing protein
MTTNHPPTLDRNARLALIALLSAEGIGNRRAMELVTLFHTPEAALKAPAGEVASALNVPLQVGRQVVKAGRSVDAAEKKLAAAERCGARVVTFWDEEYPERLKGISDPPTLLYVRGENSPLYQYAVAVVGTRTPSEQGRRMAVRIARELATTGVTVVSGMAMGIDSLAHEGALAAGGRTIAVLGSGVDVVYPPSNRQLCERIIAQGAVFTEYPPGTGPDRHHFPQRNRIISGLSLGTVIVEAGAKSGALITAKLALEQGRELFAVPGAAGDMKSAGVNQLLRDGAAHLVEKGSEVVEHLKSRLAPVLNVSAAMAVPKMEGAEKTIYNLLEAGPVLVDELIRRSNLGAVEVSRVLTSMQLKSLVQRLPGARVSRA